MRYLIPLFMFIAMSLAIALPTSAQSLESDVFDPVQFKELIVEPTLADMESVFPGASHPAAINLMVGIAIHESKGGTYLKQIKGPARGVFQVEPFTESDIWNTYLKYRPERYDYALSLLPAGFVENDGEDVVILKDALTHDLRYSLFMARMKIYRGKFQWREPDNLHRLGVIWDEVYNANPDKGQHVPD